jgi:hypothetical protein
MEACLHDCYCMGIRHQAMLRSLARHGEWDIYEWLRHDRGIALSMLEKLVQLRDICGYGLHRRDLVTEAEAYVIMWTQLHADGEALRGRFVMLTGGPLV